MNNFKNSTIMFKTINEVHHLRCDSSIYVAYFEDYNEAKAFVEQEMNRVPAEYEYTKRTHLDGSFIERWADYYRDIHFVINDYSWVTDNRANGGVLFYERGLPTRFESMDDLRVYIKASQDRAKS